MALSKGLKTESTELRVKGNSKLCAIQELGYDNKCRSGEEEEP